jgi:outer membrane protein OmpA-like peptidoglycan-associated protein
MKNKLHHVHWSVLALAFLLSPSFSISVMKPIDVSQRAEQYSLTKGQVVPVLAKKATLPLIVYGDDIGQVGTFVPSGYMGDAAGLEVKSVEDSVTLKSGAPGVHSLRVSYLSTDQLRRKSNREGWAGVYWQTPANNWAKVKGAGYDLSAAEKITFWVRGEKGGEVITEVKVGGLMGPYPDTDVSSVGPLRLTKEWKQFEIPLKGKDLKHISGGFAFTVRRSANPHGAVFFIDEIMYEGRESAVVPTQTALNAPLSEATRKGINKNIPTETLTEVRKWVVPYKGKETTVTDYQSSLDEIVQSAYKYISARILIEGHTDSVGAEDVNQKLSLERAKAVADYFESKGIDPKRITVEGYGEELPLVPESGNSEEERAKNRRLEISLLPN